MSGSWMVSRIMAHTFHYSFGPGTQAQGARKAQSKGDTLPLDTGFIQNRARAGPRTGREVDVQPKSRRMRGLGRKGGLVRTSGPVRTTRGTITGREVRRMAEVAAHSGTRTWRTARAVGRTDGISGNSDDQGAALSANLSEESDAPKSRLTEVALYVSIHGQVNCMVSEGGC